MDNNIDYKYKARKRASIKKTGRIMVRGFRNILSDWINILLVVLILIVWVVVISVKSNGNTLFEGAFTDAFNAIGIILGSVIILAILCYIFGRPSGARTIEAGFASIGLENSLGEVPELERIDDEDGVEITMHLYNCGLPLSRWEDKKNDIESILGVVITSISVLRGSRHVQLKCVNYEDAYGRHQSYKHNNTYKLIVNVGVKPQGVEVIDFSKTAHAIIGGATGSGKTETLRNIVSQCIKQGAETYIVDFKGGIDYSEPIWDKATMVTDYEPLVQLLRELSLLVMMREHELKMAGYKNIEEALGAGYESENTRLNQIVVAFDEIAEALDKSGSDKETKGLIDQVIGSLSTIARLGRALGIHLILCTQRPDATIIPGQIRNNMTYRLCGHADRVLSQIVLDNSLAAEIPAGHPGLFVNQDGDQVKCDRPNFGRCSIKSIYDSYSDVATMFDGWE